MPRKLTHEQFIDKFNKQNKYAKDIEILGTYVNYSTKIKCKCRLDGHIWEVVPNSLLNGYGCPKCAGNIKKTHEQFITELSQINPNIQVLGTYKGSHTKIKCKCKIDEHEWEAFPTNLLRGQGCPICGRKQSTLKQTKTHEEFIKELSQINTNIEILGTYVNANTKIKCRCKIDGYEWETKPSRLLNGHGCPICGRKKIADQLTKTHEQFIKELQQVNQDIEILGTYVNSQTKIKCKCKVCGHIWEATPDNLLNGTGCPICAINNSKKTHDQFLQELQQINQNIEVLGTYVTGNTKIKVRCKLDGYEWEVRPNSLLSGYGCPVCAGKMKKTHEQFIKELYKINPDIEVLGTYVNTRTKIKCKCRLDEHIWEATPNSLLQGHGCPKCANKKIGEKLTKTHEQFLQELYKINENIEILSEYKGTNTPIKCKCKLDGYEWSPTPNSLLNGRGCAVCAGTLKKTHDQFLQELYEVNPDIEILGTYINNHTKIKCRCKIDGHEWEVKPSSLLSGQGCPKCNTSKGEKRVAQYLDNNGINYIYNKQYFNDLVTVKGAVMRPDFIIPSLKIWIEYDGEQHFKPVDFSSKMSEQQIQEQFKMIQQNDQIKNQYAKQHNWTLIRIPYWEIDNIEQILDNYIKEQERAQEAI